MHLVLAVILLVPSASGENPAVQVTLSGKALQYGKATARLLIQVLAQALGMTRDHDRCALPSGAYVGAQWITDKLKGVSLPDISGDMFILFDTLYYTLTG